MRNPGKTKATLRFDRDPYRWLYLAEIACALLVAVATLYKQGPTLQTLLLVAVAGVGVMGYEQTQRRGTWQVEILPDGSLTSTVRSVVGRQVITTRLNLGEAHHAQILPIMVRVTGPGGPRTVAVEGVIFQEDSRTVVFPLTVLRKNPGLLAAMRTHTLSNPRLADAPLTEDTRRLVVGYR